MQHITFQFMFKRVKQLEDAMQREGLSDKEVMF